MMAEDKLAPEVEMAVGKIIPMVQEVVEQGWTTVCGPVKFNGKTYRVSIEEMK